MYMHKAQFFSNENHVEWGSVLVVMSSSLPTVVPLTTGHVTRVMEKTKDFNYLCELLDIPKDKRGSAASAAEYYVHHSTQPRRVRYMIYILDELMKEPGLADSVMECAEPPAGVCVSSDDMYMYIYVVDCISEKELHVHTSGWLLTIYCVCNVHVHSQHLLVTCTYSAHCGYFPLPFPFTCLNCCLPYSAYPSICCYIQYNCTCTYVSQQEMVVTS